MTTAGKSDPFEAVVEILVLSILRKLQLADRHAIASEVLRRATILPFVQPSLCNIALHKLENSGWVRRNPPAKYGEDEPYCLTHCAAQSLPRELQRWERFAAAWPEIHGVLTETLSAG